MRIAGKTPQLCYLKFCLASTEDIMTNKAQENQEISILMNKKARTRLKFFLEVKERLLDKD
jgi:hypothetical protein